MVIGYPFHCMGLAIRYYKASAETLLRYAKVTVKAEIIFIVADADLAVLAVNELKAALIQRKSCNGCSLLMTDVDWTFNVEFV